MLIIWPLELVVFFTTDPTSTTDMDPTFWFDTTWKVQNKFKMTASENWRLLIVPESMTTLLR